MRTSGDGAAGEACLGISKGERERSGRSHWSRFFLTRKNEEYEYRFMVSPTGGSNRDLGFSGLLHVRGGRVPAGEAFINSEVLKRLRRPVKRRAVKRRQQ